MRWFCSVILILIAGSLRSQEPQVKTWFDTSSVLIGDQLYFNVETSHPPDVKLSYPAVFSDSLVGGIEILRAEIGDTLRGKDNTVTLLQRYLVTSFDTGFYEVAPLFAEIVDDGGRKRYYSEYSSLEVLRDNITPPDSTMAFFDIVAPRKAKVTVQEVLPWAGIILVLALVIWLMIRYFPSREKTEMPDDSHLPAEPLHITALRELDKLEKRELWQQSRHKEYYSELTEILRRYIDRRYGLSSMEMTSWETLSALRGTGFERGDLYNVLEKILTTADLSKFAKYIPSEEINKWSIDNARVFVRGTAQHAVDNPGNEKLISSEKGREEVPYE